MSNMSNNVHIRKVDEKTGDWTVKWIEDIEQEGLDETWDRVSQDKGGDRESADVEEEGEGGNDGQDTKEDNESKREDSGADADDEKEGDDETEAEYEDDGDDESYVAIEAELDDMWHEFASLRQEIHDADTKLSRRCEHNEAGFATLESTVDVLKDRLSALNQGAQVQAQTLTNLQRRDEEADAKRDADAKERHAETKREAQAVLEQSSRELQRVSQILWETVDGLRLGLRNVINTRWDSIQLQLVRWKKTEETLEANMNAQMVEVCKASDSQAASVKRLADATENLTLVTDGYGKRLDTAEGAYHTLREENKGLKAQVADQAAAIKALTESVESLKKDRNQTRGEEVAAWSNKEHSERFKIVMQLLAQLSGKVAALETGKEMKNETEQKTQALAEILETVGARVETLEAGEKQQEDSEQEVQKVAQALDQVTARVDAVETKMDEMTVDVRDRQADIIELEEQVEQLTAEAQMSKKRDWEAEQKLHQLQDQHDSLDNYFGARCRFDNSNREDTTASHARLLGEVGAIKQSIKLLTESGQSTTRTVASISRTLDRHIDSHVPTNFHVTRQHREEGQL